MSDTAVRVTATHVGVHFLRTDLHFRERTCCRCGIVETISERKAGKERKANANRADYRCEDCAPVRFWR